MTTPKTTKNNSSVKKFIECIEDKQMRLDCLDIKKMLQKLTGKRAAMWGDSIVGFGSFHYKYASGREGDWMLTGFSPRKTNISIYVMTGFSGLEKELSKLGKHKTGKSCLYIRKLEHIDLKVLEKILKTSFRKMEKKYG